MKDAIFFFFIITGNTFSQLTEHAHEDEYPIMEEKTIYLNPLYKLGNER